MASHFPHHYDVKLVVGNGSAVLTGGSRPAIVGGPPPEFDGRAEWWSPEHLLLSSVGLCLMTTFKALASRSGLAVAGYESRIEGVLDKRQRGSRSPRSESPWSCKLRKPIVLERNSCYRAPSVTASSATP